MLYYLNTIIPDLMVFYESGWAFEFEEGWLVKKFDHHRYYQSLSGNGFKGMDFIAIKPNQQLLLLEVKNYRDQEPPSSEALAETFCQKVEDSLHVIELIQKYYYRKWYYRMLHSIIQKRPVFFGEWGFWTEVMNLVKQGNSHTILWIEAPVAPVYFFEHINEFVQSNLPSSFTFSMEPHQNRATELGVNIYLD